MVPIPASILTSTTPSNVLDPAAGPVLEDAIGGLPLPLLLPLPKSLLITLLTLFVLYYLLPRIFYFLYPIQDPEALLQTVRDIEQLIKANTSVSKGSNTLQGVAGELKTRLKKLHTVVILAKTRQEPPRWRVWVWLMFKWTTVRTFGKCSVGLRELKGEIEALIEFASDEEEESSSGSSSSSTTATAIGSGSGYTVTRAAGNWARVASSV